MELRGAREFGAFAMPTDEGVQVGWSDPNGIEDSKVRQVSAQSFAADTRSKDEKSLRDTEAAWSKAAATKDVDRIVSYYADDASVFPANAPIAKSKDEIKKLWSGLVGAPGSSISWETTTAVAAKSARSLAGRWRVGAPRRARRSLPGRGFSKDYCDELFVYSSIASS